MAGEEPDSEVKISTEEPEQQELIEEEAGKSEDCPDVSTAKPDTNPDSLSSQRVFKKSSPNNKLTLYLSSRDLVVTEDRIDRLQGVLLVDPEYIDNKKVYGQVTLTFRYGREDEEVMGLKFCNEAVMCLAQLYPPHPSSTLAQQGNTPLQDALMKRLGPNAYPFTMEITPLAPPSVQLVPAKEYNGAPIGTSYDVRAYIAERPDEKLQRKTTVRMGIRVVQRATAPPSPIMYNPAPPPPTTSTSTSTSDKKHRHHVTRISTLFSRNSEDTRRTAKTTRTTAAEVECSAAKFKQDPEFKQSPARVTEPAKGSTTGDSPKVTFKEHLANGVEGSEPGDSPRREANPDGAGRTDSVSSTPAKQSSASEQICSDNESSQMEHIQTLCRAGSLASAFRDVPAPHAAVDKPFLLSDGRVSLEASLDRAIYSHGQHVQVHVHVHNNSSKTVRRIKVFVVQHVDVCMFSNGKFKNVVAIINCKDDCPVSPGMSLDRNYNLSPTKGSTKNWIALEDSYTKSGTSLASTVTCNTHNPEDRNVFAIYVSYYVKVKLLVSVMGGELSLKLPFTLMHTCPEYDPRATPTRMEHPAQVKLDLKPPPLRDNEGSEGDVEQEKDGT